MDACASSCLMPRASYQFKDVSKLLLLRFEVLARRLRRRDLERNALDDLEAEALDGDVLRGIVRHQANLADAQVAEDLRAGAVVADVGCEAELRIRLDRVVTLVLQFVRFELVDQTDAASFLQEIEHDALSFLRDPLERPLELIAAVAAVRMKHVAGEARRVAAPEHVLVFLDL